MFPHSVYQAPTLSVIADQVIAELLVHPEAMFKVGVQLAAGYPHVKVGDVLGQITAAGANQSKYRRVSSVLLKNAQVTGDSTFVLTDQLGALIEVPFIPGEIITIGSQATKTITTVNNTAGTLTISGTLGGSESAGAAVALTTADGSQTAACIAARPAQSPLNNPSLPEVNYLLDTDYLIDAIWQGIVKRSVVRGLTAAGVTSLSIQTLYPYMDALIIR